jgi:hypothetical protein
MTIYCEKCGTEYEIVETYGNTDVASVCPDCGHENKGKMFNSEFVSEAMYSEPRVKKLSLGVAIFRWFLGIVWMLVMVSYILTIAESGTADRPFLYYFFAFVAGLVIIPPLRSKTNPSMNIIVYFICAILSTVFYFLGT